jgi:Uma2 family endonuclease
MTICYPAPDRRPVNGGECTIFGPPRRRNGRDAMVFAERERVRVTRDAFRAFLDQPENQDRRFELIDGEIEEVNAPKPLAAYVADQFFLALAPFVRERDLGWVFSDSVGYVFHGDNEIIPDCSYFSKARHPAFPLPDQFLFAPDLAIEVISPSNRPRAMMDKIEIYLRGGTRLVWAAHPEKRLVDVCTLAADGGVLIHKVDHAGTLSGGEVLPGFTLALSKVFPQ